MGGRPPPRCDWPSVGDAVGEPCKFLLEREEQDTIDYRIETCSSNSFECGCVCTATFAVYSLAYSLAEDFDYSATNTSIAHGGHAVTHPVVYPVSSTVACPIAPSPPDRDMPLQGPPDLPIYYTAMLSYTFSASSSSSPFQLLRPHCERRF